MSAAIVDASSPRKELKIFECFVSVEEDRRARESKTRTESLEEFEKRYHGVEVGWIRRAFNRATLSHLRLGGDLIDYGCGSYWWKEYWPHYDNVYAVEVVKQQLEDIGVRYPQARLIYTRNGLVDPNALDIKKFDVVMSSSVVGYILPIQAKYHLQSCHDLLKPGGQLMLTRIRAFNVYDFVRSNRLTCVADTSFSYAYTASELRRELEKLGFKDIQYHVQGVRLPIPWKAQQFLYRMFPVFMTSVAPRLFPILKVHHMLTATR